MTEEQFREQVALDRQFTQAVAAEYALRLQPLKYETQAILRQATQIRALTESLKETA